MLITACIAIQLCVMINIIIAIDCSLITESSVEVLATYNYPGSQAREGPLVQPRDGNFYFTYWGNIFRISPDFNYNSSILTTNSKCSDLSRLVSSGSYLYGLTPSGVFRSDLSGNLIILYQSASSASISNLMQASDGNLYGHIYDIIHDTNFALFRLNPINGQYTNIYTFNIATDGCKVAALIEGLDGYLYGLASQFGPNNAGTLFRVNKTSGTFTVIYVFSIAFSGAFPMTLIQDGITGDLFGTTLFGGGAIVPNAQGTIFQFNITTSQIKVLYGFKNSGGSLYQYRNGYLYGLETGIKGLERVVTLYSFDIDNLIFTILSNYIGYIDMVSFISSKDGYFYGLLANTSSKSTSLLRWH